jgi:hypothetical protein
VLLSDGVATVRATGQPTAAALPTHPPTVTGDGLLYSLQKRVCACADEDGQHKPLM